MQAEGLSSDSGLREDLGVHRRAALGEHQPDTAAQ
jgi:hypothetical protein